MNRDQTLDNLRGIAMLQVILVHTFEWTALASDNILYTLILFEMPVFFFVSGAVYKKKTSYNDYVKQKIVRILKPYYKYAFVCVLLTFLFEIVYGCTDISIFVRIAFSWLFPTSFRIFPIFPMTKVPYLGFGLWFPLVFLGVILLLPFVKKNYTSGLVIGLIYALCCLFGINYLQYVSFYLLWAFAGFYYKELKNNRKVTAIISAISLGILCILGACGLPMNMHENKFPPNFIFGVYTLFSTFAIISLIPIIDKFVAWIRSRKIGREIFDAFSMESLTIYYWQPFAFLMTVPITKLVIPEIEMLRVAVCFVLTVIVCTFFVKVKRNYVKTISKIWYNNREQKNITKRKERSMHSGGIDFF